MWPDRISNPGPLTYESGALLTALRSLVKDRQAMLHTKFQEPEPSSSKEAKTPPPSTPARKAFLDLRATRKTNLVEAH